MSMASASRARRNGVTRTSAGSTVLRAWCRSRLEGHNAENHGDAPLVVDLARRRSPGPDRRCEALSAPRVRRAPNPPWVELPLVQATLANTAVQPPRPSWTKPSVHPSGGTPTGAQATCVPAHARTAGASSPALHPTSAKAQTTATARRPIQSIFAQSSPCAHGPSACAHRCGGPENARFFDEFAWHAGCSCRMHAPTRHPRTSP